MRQRGRTTVLTACMLLITGAAVPIPASVLAASTSQAMCMVAGERTSGFNKLCYYDCLGSTHVVTQSSVSLCALSVPAPVQPSQHPPRTTAAPPPVSTTCFARGEQSSGMNKICYYDCLGSARAITQSSVSLCPLTIQQ